MRRVLILTLAGLAVGAVLAFVVPATTGDDRPKVHVTLRVYDGTLRKPGVVCSGAAGYVAVHKGASWAIVDPNADKRLDRGKLPAGVAVRSGNPIEGAAVEPTACQFRFDVSIPDRAHYELELPERRPLGFDRSAFGRDRKLDLRIP